MHVRSTIVQTEVGSEEGTSETGTPVRRPWL